MTSISRLLILLFAAMLMLTGGCKKTVEGEEKAYKANVAEITSLKAQYPGFEGALQERLTKAEGIYDAAGSLSDQAKIDKLAEANSALRGGFVTDLKTMEKKIEELRKKRVEAASKAGDESSRLGAKVAAEDAQKAIDRVEKALKKGAKDEAGAKAVIKKATKDIDTALAAVKKVLETDKAKKDEKKAEKDAKEKKAADKEAKEAAKVADWKCEYCGSTNKHDVKECGSCGAPRKK